MVDEKLDKLVQYYEDEDWDTQSTQALTPEYATRVAAEVIAEAAYGVSAVELAGDVQIAAAGLALAVASAWLGGGFAVQFAAGDAPSQVMVATAMAMMPRATVGDGTTTVIKMTGAATDYYGETDALSVRNRFKEAAASLGDGFDFQQFINNLGGVFVVSAETFAGVEK
ncbi:hypothetical protein [Bifidobacterium dentium]|uniref:hypothetical protein n=1 Tax=Bifidobacterium dentium TaxID=1689 RepID=UPI001F515103|nr:hypothetical protein [Bifidobacterium dentium]